MLRFRGVVALLVSGIALGSLAVGSAKAADAKATGQVFATVDVESAFNGYEKKKQLEAELQTLVEQARMKLELRNSSKLLTSEEFNQYLQLKQKPKPIDADQKKMDEFAALEKQREQEFQTLQQKTGPTDADKQRLTQLQNQIRQVDQELKDDQGKAEQELGKKRVDLSVQVMQDVNNAVAAVAKEKGVTMVFNKSAGEPGLVLYSNFDITDDVLKKLNKK